MVKGCAVCTRLWDEYAEAISEHLKLDNKLRLARLSAEPEITQELTQSVTKSSQKRMALREQIGVHDVELH